MSNSVIIADKLIKFRSVTRFENDIAQLRVLIDYNKL